MKNYAPERLYCNPTAVSRARRAAMQFIGIGLAMPMAACGKGTRKVENAIWLHVVMYSYVDRVITDIAFNDTNLGVANRYGGTGTITGVRIPFGVQALTWTLGGPKGTPRNGERVSIANRLYLLSEQIPVGTRYLGLRLYPDNAAEITLAPFIPERTSRGEEILSAGT